uniref:NADH-ubiquinone oxidoreductase chain 6 n=1 Tax=Drepanocerus kirbyi TaxID=206859 RepID=A0A1X9HF46_9SCAR|nr:NADH deshydrogenase subunit 6 [Drepanocerus kirbyi]
MIMMMIMMFMSILIIWLKHPLSMGLILLIHTINMAMFMGYYHLNYWFSYILFLILIGSMLILFIYMTSVASNEKFNLSMKLFMFCSLNFLLYMIITLFHSPFYTKLNNKIEFSSKMNFSLIKYINFPNQLMYYLLIIYLLVCLIAIVQITNFKLGSLRSST